MEKGFLLNICLLCNCLFGIGVIAVYGGFAVQQFLCCRAFVQGGPLLAPDNSGRLGNFGRKNQNYIQIRIKRSEECMDLCSSFGYLLQ